MGTLMEILCEFPYGNPVGIPIWESHENLMGIPTWESYGNSNVGILWEFPYGSPMGIPTENPWEWDGNGN